MPSVADETSPPGGGEVAPATERSGLPNGETKNWEHEWGLTEMRQNAADWSLASDAGLLRFLQDFSSKLTVKAHEATQGINNLLHDTHMTDAKLCNVTDRFLTLSDSQFIENRVYDEDVSSEANGTDAKTEDKGKEASENQEIDATPKLSEAISYGIKVLDEAFDILDANAANSDFDSDLDSEDENDDAANGMPQATQGIYEAKDPYVARPLPHLIGSRGFHELDHVGVADIPSDDEVQDDQGSVSESEEEEDDAGKTQKSNDASSSSSSEYESDLESTDSEPDVVKRKSTQGSEKRSEYSSSEQEEDLFRNDDEDSLSDDAPAPVIKKAKAKPHKKHHRKQEEDLFQEADDEEDLFAGSGGLFGTGSNLFTKKNKGDGGLFGDIEDEEEEEEDSTKEDGSQKLSSDDEEETPEQEEIEEKKPTKPAKKTYGGVSLFGGAVNKEIFSKIKKDDDSEKSSRTGSLASVHSSKKNLFESSDEDDDLFRKGPPPATTKSSASPASSKASRKETKSLFDSESETNEPAPVPKKKAELAPKKAAPMKAASDLFASDSDDDGDLFSGGFSKKETETKYEKNAAAPSKKSTPSKKVPAKLPSSSEDDMFSEKPPPIVDKPVTIKKGGLFDDDDDDDSFFAPKPVKQKTKKEKISIFSDSDSDDMFSSVTKTNQKPAKEAPPPASKPKSGSNASPQSGSLFSDPDPVDLDDDSEEPVKKEPARKKLPGAVPMFMGAMGGNELAAAINKRRADSEVSTKSSASSKTESEDNFRNKQDITPPKAARTESSILQNATAKPFQPTGLDNVTAKPFQPTRPIIIPSKPTPSKPEPPTTSKKSITALGAKLSIDPRTLLPGAAPKQAPVVPTEISFDKPPVVKTLENVNKTRSRGQANRRPPSRHKRSSQVEPGPVAEKRQAISPEPEAALEGGEQENIAVEEKADIEKKGKTEKEDLFSLSPEPDATKSATKMDTTDDFDAELFSGSLFSTTKRTTPTREKVNPVSDDLFHGDGEDDTFGSSEKPKATDSEKKLASADGDLFGNSSITPTKRTGPKTAPKLFSDDDDIFGDIDFLKPTKMSSEKRDEDDIFADDADFLLPASGNSEQAGPAKKEVGDFGPEDRDNKGAKSKTDQQSSDIFGDDDGDIFGGDDVGVMTSATESKPIETASDNADSKAAKPDQKGTPDIFGDDDGDIFGEDDAKVTSAPKTKRSATEKKGGLFGDEDEDIFAEAPKKEHATKVKKTTKKQAKSSKVKSIFDDDDDLDDIFLSSTSKKTPKKKKTTTKSSGGQTKKTAKTKPAETTTANVFDDPLSMP